MPLKEYDAIRLRDEIQGTLGNRDAIEQGPFHFRHALMACHENY